MIKPTPMPRLSLLMILFALTALELAWAASPAQANPFTQKQTAPAQALSDQDAQARPDPPGGLPLAGADPGLLMQITMWQHNIKTQMTQWIRQARSTGHVMPLVWVLGAALVYGMVHSAGPGHGKAVALSYIFCFKPGLARGLAFGNILAFCHGMSGVLLVLAVKFIFDVSITASLDRVTRITQVVSFSLITLMGLVLFLKPLAAAVFRARGRHPASPPDDRAVQPSLWSAAAMGMIPCPGVVMAMLFSLSMGLPLFGVLLGLAISTGMAATLSLVVILGISGKSALLSALPGSSCLGARIETIMETLAGLAVAVLGSLFLLAAI